jgi:hypothetical protein
MDAIVGFCDFKGKEVIPVTYKTGLRFSGFTFCDGLWPAEVNGKTGYVNAKNEIVIAPAFYYANDFSNGFANVTINKDDETVALINKKGDIIITEGFKTILPFSKAGFAYAQTRKKNYVIINTKGKVLKTLGAMRICNNYTTPMIYKCGITIVQDTITEKFGGINEKGDIIIPLVYDGCGGEDDGIILFNSGGTKTKEDSWIEKTGGTWCMLDATGKVIFKNLQADKVDRFAEGMACITKNGLYGFINTKGEIVIEPQFTEKPGYFDGPLCRISGNDRPPFGETGTFSIGYINKLGKFVWEMQK